MNKIAAILFLCLLCFETMGQANDNYTITNYTEQHKASVYGIIKYNGQWYVTSADKKSTKRQPYSDIFVTDARLMGMKPFASEVMTDLDEGTPTFSGRTMYYTSVYNEFLKETGTNTKKLKIMIASTDGRRWKKEAEFPYNSPRYRTAHPTISPDGNMLVFVSDMPGAKGAMDLFYCTKQGNSWSEPQNIISLNTAKNELFPIFDNEGNLVFSSNGMQGLGGLDLYTSKVIGEEFSQPVHLEAPLNSKYDDFLLFSDDGMKTGYISSNRFVAGKDDILYFSKTQIAAKVIGFSVSVLDKYTRTPLPYALIIIKDASGQVLHQGMTGPDGVFTFEELPIGNYTVQGMLNDISTNIERITDKDFNSGQLNRELLHNDPRFTLAGMAVNTKTQAPLEGVNIACINTSTGKTKNNVTKVDGKFFFQLEQNSDFDVQGQKKGWLSSEVVSKTTKGLDRTTQLYVNIELKIERPVNNGTITLRQIHYDYNKSDIRPDVTPELDRVLQLMNDYPDMSIELSSHTDSRGSDEYNMKLSQARADAAVKYLESRGVTRSRIIAKGYGETRLLNKCKNSVECTEEQHAQNRRTDFTVLSCPSCSNE